MDWHDLKIIASIAGGSLIAAWLSTVKTWQGKAFSIACGVFFAVVFTGPVLHWAGFSADEYEFAICGLLAMTGDRLARRIVGLAENGELPWQK